jgi:FkbM family methyltransferase
MTPWEAKSRFGAPGRLARRALRRLLRPLEVRQREVDRSLLSAIAGIAAEDPTGTLGFSEPLVGRSITDHELPFGKLYFPDEDVLVGPFIKDHGEWAPDIAHLLQAFLAPGGTFVDVGANVGYFSVMASRLVGAEGRVFAVEPDPSNVAILRANLWRNEAANVRLLPIAAWDGRGHLSMIELPEGGAVTEVSDDPAAAEQDPRVNDGAARVLVPCERLDQLILGPVDVIKVDTQFTDHVAIRGAERIIHENPGIALIVEFCPADLRKRGEDPAEILAYYQRLGFKLRLMIGLEPTMLPSEQILADERPYLDLLLRRD